VQDASVRLGRIQIFNNWSPYMVENPDKTVWIGLEYFCQEGDDFWNMTDESCMDLAIGELAKLQVIDPNEVLSSHIERVKKAYPAYFGSYDRLDRVVSFLNGFENLYCVGRNGQHRYNNMDHSMATAFEAVDNIRINRTDKGNIWGVNTEQAYHEKK
jgi:protoporphyrinogen oxidase